MPRRKMTITKRFPPVIEPDTRNKILVLILDHFNPNLTDKTQQNWGDKDHQAFLDAFKDDYRMEASSPATTESCIRFKNADIIFVIKASKLDRHCNAGAIARCLRNFATEGGSVIFGGVPSGFNGENLQDTQIFKNFFDLTWTVGSHFDTYNKRIVDIATPSMPNLRVAIKGTYLEDVFGPWGLYRVCDDKFKAEPKTKAQAVVVWQPYVKGYMGYVGHEDFASDASIEIFQILCAASRCNDKPAAKEVTEMPEEAEMLEDALVPKGKCSDETDDDSDLTEIDPDMILEDPDMM